MGREAIESQIIRMRECGVDGGVIESIITTTTWNLEKCVDASRPISGSISYRLQLDRDELLEEENAQLKNREMFQPDKLFFTWTQLPGFEIVESFLSRNYGER
ncbi:hypothetical protein PTTG_27892 [Puccinia triticina 1-1 BBBD Race 1]|uniref:Uncharacterized protein n=2 Tax=Puccinia triticina TaxID=208348 RepID=A0A180GG47_PUCT1|nr:uncharacterized protein PtA15_15A81 [Puccinia triticina]OAV91717.1 hypothetical protein PTTG_27892 [Puccinia triticina 1-1 BBBD Race 1]WAQ91690.1 hypothetical protein PtA15_15A81 [Puccinia triticina]WAR62491.1 hypothetical protein PtB15_15B76 [Puccinia triticina]